jgi:hypothetical protein
LKTLVEHCLCRVAIKLVAAAVAAKQPVMSYCLPGTATPAVSQLLDLGLWLSTRARPNLPCFPLVRRALKARWLLLRSSEH